MRIPNGNETSKYTKKTHNTLERSTLSILMAEIEHPMSMYFQNILTFIKLNKIELNRFIVSLLPEKIHSFMYQHIQIGIDIYRL